MPDHVPLNGGLDLISAPPAVLPGAIRKCLNYEVGYRRGYGRIDGFERYDGQVNPATTNVWLVTDFFNKFTGTFVDGESLTWATSTNSGFCGIQIEAGPTLATTQSFYMAMREGEGLPDDGAVITGSTSGATYEYTVGKAVLVSGVTTDPDDFLASLSARESTLRDLIGEVPGAGRIVGAHLHNDDVYAVRDLVELRVDPGGKSAAAPGIELGQYLITVSTDVLIEVVEYDPSEAPSPRLMGHILDGSGAFTGYLYAPDVVRFSSGSGGFAVGDDIQGNSSSHNADVRFVDVRNGSFEAGNAEGVMVLDTPGDTSTYTDGEAVTNNTQTGSFTIDAVLQDYYNVDSLGVAEIDEVFVTSSKAAMYKASLSGWQRLKHARVIPFDTGTTNPDDLASVATDSGALFSATQTALGTETPAWTGALTGLEAADDSGPSVTLPVGTGLQTSDVISCSGYSPNILDTDVITGLEVEVRFRGVTSGAGTGGRIRVLHTPLVQGTGPADEVKAQQYWTYAYNGTTSWTTVSFGGVGAFWGEPRNIAPARVRASDFSFELQASSYEGGIEVDFIRLKVHYERPGLKDKWYIWDGSSDVGWIRVSKFSLDEGAWDGSGVGEFTLWDWSGGAFDLGDQIRTAAAGGGLLVADIAGATQYPYLPGSRRLDAEKSRYQFMSHNFFASEDTRYIYGVSGAGKAFFYDDEVLDFISTGVDENLDKPRHLAHTQGRLALGYKWGEVYLSSSVDPTIFDATLLASSHGFGDRLTGLLNLKNIALGVFTESSIHGLYGAALDSEGAGIEQKVISPNAGAIEYTVQDMGNLPLFTNFQGVNTIESVEQYGDFNARPLSEKISPWLKDRIQRRSGFETVDKLVRGSLVVRSKNQYRLFFSDGWVMTLTLFGGEREPQCTFQRLWFGGDEDKYLRMFALSSGVMESGRERLFFSIRDPNNGKDYSGEIGYLYELDSGRNFDGGSVRSFIEVSHNFGEDPAGNERWEPIQIHGFAVGVASLHLSRALNYEEIDDADPQPYEPFPLGSGSDTDWSPEERPFLAKGRLTGRGFAVTVRIDHESAVEFPHTLQMLTFTDRRRRRLER